MTSSMRYPFKSGGSRLTPVMETVRRKPRMAVFLYGLT